VIAVKTNNLFSVLYKRIIVVACLASGTEFQDLFTSSGGRTEELRIIRTAPSSVTELENYHQYHVRVEGTPIFFSCKSSKAILELDANCSLVSFLRMALDFLFLGRVLSLELQQGHFTELQMIYTLHTVHLFSPDPYATSEKERFLAMRSQTFLHATIEPSSKGA
jgi:hypothetical protein